MTCHTSWDVPFLKLAVVLSNHVMLWRTVVLGPLSDSGFAGDWPVPYESSLATEAMRKKNSENAKMQKESPNMCSCNWKNHDWLICEVICVYRFPRFHGPHTLKHTGRGGTWIAGARWESDQVLPKRKRHFCDSESFTYSNAPRFGLAHQQNSEDLW